ncbi:unnamed protein product [Acanthoscelides obtectus]|uniref:Uncharacterized protein n=1 Tax=Acanthoscelides obtectus TaxID=200917 RepID=A0A9P0Q4M2_ACAOB|nr:unnamed protein product [Acanthoscelides obtectus]CAK1656983.1 hypothetical protein AOBTE_LOCUS20057 [Acanthoscelides obtectus]
MHQQRMERVQVHTPRSPVAACDAASTATAATAGASSKQQQQQTKHAKPSKATAKHRPRPASLRRTRDQRNWREFVLTAVSSQVQR